MLSARTKIRNGYVAHMWAKWLNHPYRLGSPQRSARGQKSEMATWPRCGQNAYITPAVLRVPNTQRGDKKQKWLCGPHVGKKATSALPSWGSPTLNAGTKIRNGYVPHMWAKRLDHPFHLGGSQRSVREQKSETAKWSTIGQSGYITPAVLEPTPRSAGNEIRNGHVAYIWENWLHHPCGLRSTQRLARGQK